MIEVFQSIIQKKRKNFTTYVISSLHTSKKRLGLKQNLAFNQGTRIRFGALKVWVGGRGEGIRKFVRTSAKILATPLRTVPAHYTPPPPPPPARGLHPDVQPLTLLYTIFDRNFTHFVYLPFAMVLILLT